MKTILKVSLPLMLAAVLLVSFVTITSEPVGAASTCPPTHCPQVLDGYSYVSTCATTTGPGPCLGWIYKRGGETCHVSALSGL